MFTWTPEKGLAKKWQFHDPQLVLNRSNLVLAKKNEKTSNLLIFTGYPMEDKKLDPKSNMSIENYLILLDSDNGHLLHKIPFQGATHFSMPLLFKNYIVVSTVANGLQLFKFATSPIHKWLELSFLGFLINQFI